MIMFRLIARMSYNLYTSLRAAECDMNPLDASESKQSNPQAKHASPYPFPYPQGLTELGP